MTDVDLDTLTLVLGTAMKGVEDQLASMNARIDAVAKETKGITKNCAVRGSQISEIDSRLQSVERTRERGIATVFKILVPLVIGAIIAWAASHGISIASPGEVEPVSVTSTTDGMEDEVQ